MKKYKLGDIAILNASIIDKKKNIEIEYLDTSSILEGHILGTQKICLSEAPSRAQRKVKNKTIIYSLVRPNQNHYGILYNTPDNFIVSTGFATIDLKEEFKETIDADFLFLLLTQKQITHHLHRIAENSASAYPSLIPSDITKLELNFPSIKKQKNIARLIQNINQKIELNRSINHNLEVMAKQLYDYWFLQFDFPDENGKPYKSSGGKMVWNKKLKREIPEGWSIDAIGNILDKCPTTKRYETKEYLKEGKNPIVDQGDAYIVGFTNEDDNLLTRIPAVLFGDHSTKVKLLDFVFARGADGTQILYSNNPNVSQYYLYMVISSLQIPNPGYSRHFKYLKELPIIIPQSNIVNTFTEIISPLFTLRKGNIFSNITLTKQRNELLPLLMNGQASLQNCD